MSPIGGWTVFEKQSGGKGYEKYDSIYAVIVAKSKKPAVMYLSAKAYEDLGKPTHIQIMFNGTEVGLTSCDASEQNGYTVAFTEGKPGRAFINSRSAVESTKGGKRKLKPGVYMAQMHTNGPNKILVINSNDEPSYL